MLRTLTLLLSACIGAAAQPAFEVVSIKPVPHPTPGGTFRVGFNIEANRVEILGYGLNGIIARAFQVESQQVDLHGFGGLESFEVHAKLPEGATRAQVPVETIGKNGMKLPRLPDARRKPRRPFAAPMALRATSLSAPCLRCFPS